MLAYYLNGPQGNLLTLVYLPDTGMLPTKWVLHVPAFAEEMNKSRSMVSLQARAFASRGFAVVVPDLYGTGDSEGDFGDATWSIWKNDILFLLRWMREQGAEQFSFWGLRLGALLALDVVSECGEEISEILLWQPVYSGKQNINQFLRLRMVAGMMQGQRESVGALRNRLVSGEPLEVAGYTLSPQMFAELDSVEAGYMQVSNTSQLTVFEVAANTDKPLTPASRKQVEQWRENGLEVAATVANGEPFWSTQEIAWAPGLIDCSTVALRFGGAHHSPLQLDKPENDHSERGVIFHCQEEELIGVLHDGDALASRGVLLVVGGPQYRVGSHRQFLLLARDMARHGVSVFRFDYRGMGDSGGKPVNFLQTGDDIHAAIDAFQKACPRLNSVVIWGLCDAATAAAVYAHSDHRVTGLVLLNPWVRSEAGEAKTYIKHYYAQRLFSRSLWKKVVRGEFEVRDSVSSLLEKLHKAFGSASKKQSEKGDEFSLIERMEQGLTQFNGRVLVVLSGNDLTAAEFIDSVHASPRLSALLQDDRFSKQELAAADHTFSRAQWRDQVSAWTIDWIQSW